MTEQRNAVLFSGLPGAGKTEAAQYLADVLGGTHIEAGQLIRDEYNSRHGEVESSEDLGEFAAQLREERGPGFFGDMMARRVRNREPDIEYPLLVDSFRNENGVRAARDFLTTSELLWIDTPRMVRLHRLQERGRDDEDTFNVIDLMQRDSHEFSELGVQTLMAGDEIDQVVPNGSDLHAFHASLKKAVWDVFKE